MDNRDAIDLGEQAFSLIEKATPAESNAGWW
jgi:hypothetical protein